MMGRIAAQSSTLTQLLIQLGMTLLLLAVFAALAMLAVRYLKPRMGQANGNARLQVVSRLALSQRQHIYLLKVDDRELVVGASENRMVVLAELNPSKEQSHG